MSNPVAGAIQLTLGANANTTYTLLNQLIVTPGIPPSLSFNVVCNDTSSVGGFINIALYYKVFGATDDVTITSASVSGGIQVTASPTTAANATVFAVYSFFTASAVSFQEVLRPMGITATWFNTYNPTRLDLIMRVTTGTFATTYNLQASHRLFMLPPEYFAPISTYLTNSNHVGEALVNPLTGALTVDTLGTVQRVQLTDSTNTYTATVDNSGRISVTGNTFPPVQRVQVVDNTNFNIANVNAAGQLDINLTNPVIRMNLTDSTNTYVVAVDSTGHVPVSTANPLRVAITDNSSTYTASVSSTGVLSTTPAVAPNVQRVQIVDNTNFNIADVNSAGVLSTTPTVIAHPLPVTITDVDGFGNVSVVSGTLYTRVTNLSDPLPVVVTDSTATNFANVSALGALSTTGGGGGGGGDVNIVSIAGVVPAITAHGAIAIVPGK